MKAMRSLSRIALFTLIVAMLIACKGGSAAGRYRVEQDNNFFGAGAEKLELELKADKSFSFDAGKMNMGKGTWKEDGGVVTLDWTSGVLGNVTGGITYTLKESKLVPSQDGKELKNWRFVRK